MRPPGPGGLAVFGGAFNPPHRTHVRIARAALKQLPVSELLVVPAGDHPHKRDGEVAVGDHRLAMCRLAFADMPGIRVDDRELRRRGKSFTVDTLAQIAEEQPGRDLWFVIGADNLPLLPTWRDHHRLLRLARVATFPRAGVSIGAEDLAHLDLSVAEQASLLQHRLTLPADAVAAADIRARLRRGERDLPELPPHVEHYIATHHLYGT